MPLCLRPLLYALCSFVTESQGTLTHTSCCLTASAIRCLLSFSMPLCLCPSVYAPLSMPLCPLLSAVCSVLSVHYPLVCVLSALHYQLTARAILLFAVCCLLSALLSVLFCLLSAVCSPVSANSACHSAVCCVLCAVCSPVSANSACHSAVCCLLSVVQCQLTVRAWQLLASLGKEQLLKPESCQHLECLNCRSR